ncbi:cation diffusion facilitator family transporter [uncultured Methanobrevibacter sp.]|uniref:cation diffusion facilitator family transporter n=1 Tax=uncultured Methanobrevibacter sp. TaxID=253161 RepID=UPI0026396E53
MNNKNNSSDSIHSHNYGEVHKKASENLSYALIFNLLFNIVVISGGIITNSVAIISDALHDLSDTFSIVIAWVLEKLSGKESTSSFTYGFQRFSIFGALFNSTIVILASFAVVYQAINRLFIVETPDASGMIFIAILGIIFKGASLFKLHSGKTFNERAISIHMFGDVFQWIALLIIAVIMLFVNLPILDPIASILVSLWVIYNLSKTFIASAKVLLQAIPFEINVEDLKRDLLAVDGVDSLDEFHLWSIDGIENVLTAKINLHLEFNLEENKAILEKLNRISNDYGINSTNFELIYS